MNVTMFSALITVYGSLFFVPQPFLPNYNAAVWIVIDRGRSLFFLQDHRGVAFPIEIIG